MVRNLSDNHVRFWHRGNSVSSGVLLPVRRTLWQAKLPEAGCSILLLPPDFDPPTLDHAQHDVAEYLRAGPDSR